MKPRELHLYPRHGCRFCCDSQPSQVNLHQVQGCILLDSAAYFRTVSAKAKQGNAMTKGISRRTLLTGSLFGAAGLLSSASVAAAQVLRSCADPTPGQVAGPFYPSRRRSDEDFDLTYIEGGTGRASGEVIYVRGQVLDQDCRPLSDTLVEIWQANTWGRYDHERDAANPRPLDPNFQGWGRVLSDAQGFYGFRTIKPGPYPANDQGWIRPPHIHFRITRRGYHEVITQMYFAGEALNDADLIRRSLSPDERNRVTVAFGAGPPIADPSALFGHFDLVLQRVV
jgi:protocatechuate 3,4-dioxygenase, beta subunit